MPIVSERDFAALRFRDFFPDLVPVPLENFEYMDRVWVGEAVGFNEWLCLEGSPAELGSMALDLPTLPPEGQARLWTRLGLPLAAGMSREDVVAHLGEPYANHSFVRDRVSLEFRTGPEDAYVVGCTIRHDAGLVHVTVARAACLEAPTSDSGEDD